MSCCVGVNLVGRVGGQSLFYMSETKMNKTQKPKPKANKTKRKNLNPFPKERDAQWISAGVAPRAQSRALHSFGKSDPVSPFIRTAEDLFHGALWMHLLNRHVVYPLPCILNSNDSQISTDLYVRGEGSQLNSAMTSFRAAGGLDLYSIGLGPCTAPNRVIPFRYMTSLGRVNTSFRYTVLQGNEHELWVCFDPTQTLNPIHILDVTSRTTPSSAPPVPWTTTPHLLANSFALDGLYAPKEKKGPSSVCSSQERGWECVKGSQDKEVGLLPPAANIRYRNLDTLYYDGGAQLDVDVVNPSIYGTSAFRVVSRENITHAYLNEIRLSGGAILDLPMTVNFQKSLSCTVAHSGEEWDVPFYEDLSGGQVSRNLAALRSLDRAIRRGKCVVQMKLIASGGDAEFTINLAGNSWGGSTHFDVSRAGALPYETVPFALPLWFDVGRCTGVVNGVNVHERMAEIGLNAITQAAPSMPSTTPLQSIMSQATQPRVAQAILKQIAPRVADAQPDTHLRDELKGAASAIIGQKVLPIIGNAAKRGGQSLLSGIFRSIGRGFANATGRILPALEGDVAPALIEVGEMAV